MSSIRLKENTEGGISPDKSSLVSISQVASSFHQTSLQSTSEGNYFGNIGPDSTMHYTKYIDNQACYRVVKRGSDESVENEPKRIRNEKVFNSTHFTNELNPNVSFSYRTHFYLKREKHRLDSPNY